MSVLSKIAEKFGASYLRKQLEGRKEYLALLAGVAIIVAKLLGVPVAADLDVTDTQAVVALVVASVVAARRAALDRAASP